MSKIDAPVVSSHNNEGGTFKSYTTGFVLSIILTLGAYFLVTRRSLSSMDILIAVVVGLAFIQFIVQLLFFLHLGRETKPRWKLFVLIFMITVVSILVFGSVWIMNNLNYRQQLTPQQENTYMNNQGGGF